MSEIFREILDLTIQVLVAVLVWRYYREKHFPATLKYSTFWPRFWTGSVDACVLWPIGFAAGIFIADLPPAASFALLLGQNLVWLGYTVILYTKYGQTYGKMACKVRVVDFATEGPISFRQALLREGIPVAVSAVMAVYITYGLHAASLSRPVSGEPLMMKNAYWLIPALPGLWFVAEVLTMLTNEKRRALHDFIAGTVVVRINATA